MLTLVAELPNIPAVYAMYGGTGRRMYVAYVGVADRLRDRVTQHLVLRDSSIATGTAAVGLRPEFVTEIQWWEHPSFSERTRLEAAELVAFDVLDPALRSRGGIRAASKQLYAEPNFNQDMQALFRAAPAGRLTLPTLVTALARITELERRVADLEKTLALDCG